MQPDGTVRHHAFHSYTMKQAIQEGFILDVLAHYTPVASYYRLAKTVRGRPRSSTSRRAQKKLRRFVEGSDHAIRLNYVDETLAGIRADEQTVADVVTGKLNVRRGGGGTA